MKHLLLTTALILSTSAYAQDAGMMDNMDSNIAPMTEKAAPAKKKSRFGKLKNYGERCYRNVEKAAKFAEEFARNNAKLTVKVLGPCVKIADEVLDGKSVADSVRDQSNEAIKDSQAGLQKRVKDLREQVDHHLEQAKDADNRADIAEEKLEAAIIKEIRN